MDEIKISLSAAGDENEITLIRVDGVIDTMTAAELEKVINSLLEQNRYKIIVDLAGVTYISSAGWGIFISNIREIRQQHGDLKLARMIPNVYEIFELLEFDSILKTFDDLDDAKRDFGESASDHGLSILTKLSPTMTEKGAGSVNSESAGTNGAVKTEEIKEPNKDKAFSTPSINLDKKIRSIIKRDPFLSINGIKKQLQSESYGESSVSWWDVFKWLYSHNLTSRKSRYHLSKKW